MPEHAGDNLDQRRPHRILLVTPSSPYPPTSGGAQRTALLHDTLCAHGDVDLLVFQPTPDLAHPLSDRYRLVDEHAERSAGRKLWSRVASTVAPNLHAASRDPVLRRAVDRVLAARAYDTVVLRYSSTACRLFGLNLRHPELNILVDVDDSLSRLVRQSQNLKRHRSIYIRLVEGLERRALCASNGLWVVGPRLPWMDDVTAPLSVELPNIAFGAAEKEKRSEPNEASTSTIFIGVAQFRYRANEEGFDWFVTQVWPLIRNKLPMARLRLVGMPPVRRVLARWRKTPGVEVVGQVESIEPEYADATVAIAPIQRGAGTKIKVIEAVAMGLPCVCSPHAAQGLDALSGLLVADNSPSFADLCLSLANDPGSRALLTERGKREIDEHFSREIFAGAVGRLLHASLALRK